VPRYAIRVEYDGGPFAGWQRQASAPSVQGALEAAAARLQPGGAEVLGAGRTDAGVHALGQVAHLDMARDWPAARLMAALNAQLRPHPVAVTAAAAAPDAFHARFSAVERAYLYRVAMRRAPLALDRGRAWRLGHPLDLDAVRAAAAALVGRHDFTTFRSSICAAASPVRTLDELAVETVEGPGGPEMRLRLRARSFLHNQVRSIVGTLERVGSGAWPPARVADALAARDRAACGPVAPPDGLYLLAVRYPVDPFAAGP
jgi:tRNA pseudouridine38-40 synthase